MGGHRRYLTVAAAAVLCATVPAALATAAPPPGRFVDAPEQRDCLELVPESYSVRNVTDEGQQVSLDVFVLLDTAEGQEIASRRAEAEATGDALLAAQAEQDFEALVESARDRLAPAATSYEPLGITLNLKRWDLLAPLNDDGSPRDRTTDSRSIINLAKEQFGGQRHRNSDVVYVLTDLDIEAPNIGKGVAGQADCIGGVRYPEHAFAVGEISQFENLRAGPITFYYAATAKIMAHEIGHLMGAHHHYQDCVEGIPTELDQGEVSPCTLMSNFVDFQSLNFSVVEGAVVRGHAIDYASQNDHQPRRPRP